MKRPVLFALEIVAALLLAAGGAWIAAKITGKINGKANADIRTSLAQNRMAIAAEDGVVEQRRIADALEALANGRHVLPRPSLLHPVDIKPIPAPDPDPCQSDQHDVEFSCGSGRISDAMMRGLPTLGGTARE